LLFKVFFFFASFLGESLNVHTLFNKNMCLSFALEGRRDTKWTNATPHSYNNEPSPFAEGSRPNTNPFFDTDHQKDVRQQRQQRGFCAKPNPRRRWVRFFVVVTVFFFFLI